MDWSSMTEDYVCFTETFDADAEFSELCDDGTAALGSESSDAATRACGTLATVLVVVAATALAL